MMGFAAARLECYLSFFMWHQADIPHPSKSCHVTSFIHSGLVTSCPLSILTSLIHTSVVMCCPSSILVLSCDIPHSSLSCHMTSLIHSSLVMWRMSHHQVIAMLVLILYPWFCCQISLFHTNMQASSLPPHSNILLSPDIEVIAFC